MSKIEEGIDMADKPQVCDTTWALIHLLTGQRQFMNLNYIRVNSDHQFLPVIKTFADFV